MGDSGVSSGHITLYTNHGCPWAHRAHIVLKELGVKYDEVLIDLDTPREEWFLKLNPRGLVPTLVYSHPTLGNPLIIIESGLVVSFLLDTFSSDSRSESIWPSPKSPETAYFRYRINFFVDTYFSKVNSLYFKMLFAGGTPEVDAKADDIVKAIESHIEPLLHDANPFFGGSEKMTLAEVLTASFVLRLYAFADGDIQPKSLVEKLDKLPNFSKWAKNVVAQESVTYIWDQESMVARVKETLPKMKAKYGGAAK